MKQDKTGRSYIEVNCGDISGRLYLENLKRMPNSRALEKCILSNNTLYTPQEFESLGGKKTNKAWKKIHKAQRGIATKVLSIRGTKRTVEVDPLLHPFSKKWYPPVQSTFLQENEYTSDTIHPSYTLFDILGAGDGTQLTAR